MATPAKTAKTVTYRDPSPPPPPLPWWKELHWPSVALFVVIALCAVASPIAFFALVPERIIDKVFNLPWTTLFAVGGPAIAAAIGVIRQAFQGPITRTKREQAADGSASAGPEEEAPVTDSPESSDQEPPAP